MSQDIYFKQRQDMVNCQLKTRDITNQDLLNAFIQIKRELFLPVDKVSQAYEDCPVSIGWGQTISQPFIVALMSQALEVKPNMKVLEVGTGSGYQAAILWALGAKIFTIERIDPLAQKAKSLFKALSMCIESAYLDGTYGWGKQAPYDRIIITAGASHVPKSLFNQLKIGGKLIIPLGGELEQDLTIFEKISDKEIKQERICACTFVPFIINHGH